MWPFEKRLKDQDAVQKYRNWLKKWFLNSGPLRYSAAALVLALAVGTVMTFYTVKEHTAPAFKQSKTEIVSAGEMMENTMSSIPTSSSLPDQKQLTDGKEKESINTQKSSFPPELARPVSGQLIADYGLKYSRVYGDFRFNDGLDFPAGESEKITAPAGGQIADVRDIRGEREITIDHGNGWVTKCRGKYTPLVQAGRSVNKGEPIAISPEDTLVHMVLLHGDTPVDPLPYLTGR